jgi:hypothetical protein
LRACAEKFIIGKTDQVHPRPADSDESFNLLYEMANGSASDVPFFLTEGFEGKTIGIEFSDFLS